MATDLYLLDRAGNPSLTIQGRQVNGALAGYRGLSYSPVGSALDAIPQNTVTVPLSDWRNVAVGAGTQIMVYDTDLGAEVTRGPVVGQVQITEDDTGTFWAQVTFADALHELARADVTTGFATSQDETLGTTMVRLVSLADTAWTAVNHVVGLDGIPFVATGSVMQAFDKLRQERFAHFRRLGGPDPRVIELGAFGTPFLIGGVQLLIAAPAAVPTHAAEALTVRQLLGPTVSVRADVVNSITPTGGGNGTAQLTLRTLYGTGGFAGYDPTHPVRQRIQQAGSSFDGYDYYLEDAPSVAAYGRTWGTYPKPDIAVAVNSAGGVSRVDEVTAAQSLYVAALADLTLRSQPFTQLSFATDPLLDPRNLGGLSVHVKYDGYAFDPQRGIHQFLDIDDDFIVTQIVRTVDDATGAARDQWTISTNGQAAASTGGTLLGVMDTVTALHAAVPTMPMAKPIPKSQNIGPGADLVVTIPADNTVVRRHWALMTLRLEGMVHTRADPGHTQDVITAPTPHDLGNAGADVTHDVGNAGAAVRHDIASPTFEYRVGGITQPNAHSVVYDPSAKLHIASGNPPAGSKVLMFDPNGRDFYFQGGGAGSDGDITSQALSILQILASTGGTGGTVSTTAGGTAGKVKPTTGGLAGKTVQTTHLATEGHGATLTNATEEQVYRGPTPTGVTVLVDGVQRFGPFNSSPGVMDITDWVSDQAAHTVTVKSATNGAADVWIDVRDSVAPIAVRPTGT